MATSKDEVLKLAKKMSQKDRMALAQQLLKDVVHISELIKQGTPIRTYHWILWLSIEGRLKGLELEINELKEKFKE